MAATMIIFISSLKNSREYTHLMEISQLDSDERSLIDEYKKELMQEEKSKVSIHEKMQKVLMNFSDKDFTDSA